ncbi:MAG: hypothetical protein ACLUL2_12010 [Blautia sp.]
MNQTLNRQDFSRPLSLRSVQVTDDFWKKREMELVRTQMLPYQWDALSEPGGGRGTQLLHEKF